MCHPFRYESRDPGSRCGVSLSLPSTVQYTRFTTPLCSIQGRHKGYINTQEFHSKEPALRPIMIASPPQPGDSGETAVTQRWHLSCQIVSTAWKCELKTLMPFKSQRSRNKAVGTRPSNQCRRCPSTYHALNLEKQERTAGSYRRISATVLCAVQAVMDNVKNDGD